MAATPAAVPPRTVSFPSDAFDALLPELRRRMDARETVTLLMVGEGDARHVALGRLVEALHAPFSLAPLDLMYSDHTATMLASIREAFDQASTSRALLGFDYAGVTMEKLGPTNPDSGSFTPIDYLFERARNFPGFVVVCVRRPENAALLEGRVSVVVHT